MIKIYFILFSFILFISLVNPGYVIAQKTTPGTISGDTVTLPDPLGFNNNPDAPNLLIGQIINAVMGVVGSLALVMFIYGGLTWMLAAGNNERTPPHYQGQFPL